MARKLADERAKLEEQSASDAPDDAAQSSQDSAPASHASPPAQRQAELRPGRLPTVPPWSPAAEPAWHALGTMVGLRPGEEGGSLSLMSLAEGLSSGRPWK